MRTFYCARDSVSGMWMDPLVCSNDSEAIRSFNWALGRSFVSKQFVKDIDLYCVGSFDETTGHVIPCEPVHIINGCNDDVLEIIRDNCRFVKEVTDYEIPDEKESC